jgi:hypothetical protein
LFEGKADAVQDHTHNHQHRWDDDQKYRVHKILLMQAVNLRILEEAGGPNREYVRWQTGAEVYAIVD